MKQRDSNRATRLRVDIASAHAAFEYEHEGERGDHGRRQLERAQWLLMRMDQWENWDYSLLTPRGRRFYKALEREHYDFMADACGCCPMIGG